LRSRLASNAGITRSQGQLGAVDRARPDRDAVTGPGRHGSQEPGRRRRRENDPISKDRAKNRRIEIALLPAINELPPLPTSLGDDTAGAARVEAEAPAKPAAAPAKPAAGKP